MSFPDWNDSQPEKCQYLLCCAVRQGRQLPWCTWRECSSEIFHLANGKCLSSQGLWFSIISNKQENPQQKTATSFSSLPTMGKYSVIFSPEVDPGSFLLAFYNDPGLCIFSEHIVSKTKPEISLSLLGCTHDHPFLPRTGSSQSLFVISLPL